jgi:hypothetical protein
MRDLGELVRALEYLLKSRTLFEELSAVNSTNTSLQSNVAQMNYVNHIRLLLS